MIGSRKENMTEKCKHNPMKAEINFGVWNHLENELIIDCELEKDHSGPHRWQSWSWEVNRQKETEEFLTGAAYNSYRTGTLLSPKELELKAALYERKGVASMAHAMKDQLDRGQSFENVKKDTMTLLNKWFFDNHMVTELIFQDLSKHLASFGVEIPKTEQQAVTLPSLSDEDMNYMINSIRAMLKPVLKDKEDKHMVGVDPGLPAQDVTVTVDNMPVSNFTKKYTI